MSSGNAADQTIGDRVIALLDRLHEVYDDVERNVRTYTPYVVRTVEVVLAIALLAALGHWIHWVYIAGAG